MPVRGYANALWPGGRGAPTLGGVRRDEYTEANRAAWNEAAPVHADRTWAGLLEAFARPGHVSLHKEAEVETLLEVGVAGRAVAQVCCNNGRELISISNLGAGRCVGFDISDAFVEQARELNRAAGLDCEFVRCDAYAIPHEFDAAFDLVYVSIGALGWMPDLGGFLGACARLLRPGGVLFVYEMHPFLDMLEAGSDDPLKLHHSYFRTEPYVESGGLDYYGHESYASRTMYWFHHKVSDVIAGCLGSGLALERFVEFPHDISNNFAHLEALPVKVPASYLLLARKGGTAAAVAPD